MVSTKLRVQELLREKRWTTKVLAEKTGMSESYLTHIKNGTRRWNEDALKKLALAFELHPSDLLLLRKESGEIQTNVAMPNIEGLADLEKTVDVKLRLAPVVNEIPSEPTSYNNRLMQVASGNQDKFVPVIGADDENVFALEVQDNGMSPKFVKGDLLIISPAVWTRSGDIVAVEYGQETKIREIMQVNYMEDFVVLESVNHKNAPKALVRGKDNFRIIGKVIYRYQKMS
ncbi:helix-turn-helix domain-containing protein [Candidatus Dependentiae bacterium]|nr:helix-turn-helix domain-containing protein [Candidatus Dependentiae bacterium]MBU4387347.1 helix-turn-helix domain-containing protein [Candidatus Dependentiae bacterium]MCG2756188.1 helix-turn-helix domain-containing protein [Candidatus Dependentiae bacterium]